MTSTRLPGTRPRFAAVTTFFSTIALTSKAVCRKIGWRAMPLLIVLFLLGLILALDAVAPVIAPFVYTLF